MKGIDDLTLVWEMNGPEGVLKHIANYPDHREIEIDGEVTTVKAFRVAMALLKRKKRKKSRGR